MAVAKDELVVQMVDVKMLHPDPKNPRRITERDMDRLKRSIQEDPDFMRLRPILARPDGTIYAGNMRYQAAVALGHDEVPAILTDDPEALIRKRAVKDNASFGEWVDEELGEYLAELSAMDPEVDIGALGLSDDMTRIVGLEASLDLPALDMMTATPVGDAPPSAGGIPNAAGALEREAIEAVPGNDRLQAAMNAAADVVYRGDDCEPTLDIPLYREDKLLAKLPDGLTTWAGADADQDDDVSWYLYNYSPNGTWRDVPLARVILSFFTDDRFLWRWTENPGYYVSRLVQNGVTAAVEIDLSPYEGMPYVVRALQTYRSRWLARFMQDWGIDIIPRILYPNPPDDDGDRSNDLAALCIPDHTPVLAFNAQTGGNMGAEDTNAYVTRAAGGLTWFFGEAGKSCDQLLVYGDRMWPAVEAAATLPDGMEVVVLPSFLRMRSELGLPWRDH